MKIINFIVVLFVCLFVCLFFSSLIWCIMSFGCKTRIIIQIYGRQIFSDKTSLSLSSLGFERSTRMQC